ncbi:MAG: DUF3343 domain-containing protein [Armatimonadota bacterium]|jgi:hypothetical protein
MATPGWAKLLVFDSTHRALRAEEALKAAGVAHRVIPKPAVIRADCGIAIRVAPELLDEALGCLDHADARPAGTYDFHPRFGGDRTGSEGGSNGTAS